MDWNEKGIRLKLRDIPSPVHFEWWKFDPDTARMLRKRYLGEKTDAEPDVVLLDGVRVRTAQRQIEGILLSDAPADELWIKNAQGHWIVKVSDVLGRESVKLRIQQVYQPEELYRILMERVQPFDAETWEKLGGELLRLGLRDRAAQAFNMCELLRHPEMLEGQVYRDLVRLRSRMEDLTFRKTVFDVQEQFLAGRYSEALEIVDRIERSVKDEEIVRELRRIRTELLQLRDQSREDQIIAEWGRLLEARLRMRAFEKGTGYREAAEYVQHQLLNDVQRAVSDRFGITRGDPSARLVWDRRSPQVVWKHAYGDASWLVERPELGAPAAWWDATDDEGRFRLLKGLAIEKHFVVLRVVRKNCPTCGGTGAVDRTAHPRSTAGICPSCLGLKHERTVFYR